MSSYHETKEYDSSEASDLTKSNSENKRIVKTVEPTDIPEGSGNPYTSNLAVKCLTVFTLGYLTYNAMPVMGDNLIDQSIALCKSKDSFFKKSGASRINLIATNDQRRQKIVDAGGVTVLTQMLSLSSNEVCLKEAIKALSNLSQSDAAVNALCSSGAETKILRLATVSEDEETKLEAEKILERMRVWMEKTVQQ